MARNEQLIRQHRLLQVLERYRFGRTLLELRDEVVEELGLTSLHTRSIRRDLEALQAAGFDIDSHNIQRGRVWKLGPRAQKSHQIAASATEMIALSLSRELLYPLVGTPFWLGIESFWSKLREQLPPSVWKHYKRYRQVILVQGAPAKSYERQRGVLKTLHRAILQHRVVEIEYQPLGGAAGRRLIEPYGVVLYQSSLYIVAAPHDSGDAENRFRHLKLDRFSKAKALDQWFKPDPQFDLQRHLSRSLGIFSSAKPRRFRIRVSSYAAPWVIEDPWSAEQQVQRRADGDIILSVDAAHELEIIPRVLALGAEAELLSPKSARQAIAKIVRQLVEAYGDVE